MDEGLEDIYNIVWEAIAKKLGNNHFKIALLWPQGHRGDERAEDIRAVKVDTKNNAATLLFKDRHAVRFLYDPEADIYQLLFGARRRGSPDYEARYSIWWHEYWDLSEARTEGRISEKTYQACYKKWKKKPLPEETDPEYLELWEARVNRRLTAEEYNEAYAALDEKKWGKK